MPRVQRRYVHPLVWVWGKALSKVPRQGNLLCWTLKEDSPCEAKECGADCVRKELMGGWRAAASLKDLGQQLVPKYRQTKKVETARSPSTGEWINRWWLICMIDDCAVIKRNRLVLTLPHGKPQ